MMMTAVLAGAGMLHSVVDKQFTLTLVSHLLPFWFLVFALFLPRVALVVAWFQGVLIPFHLLGLVPLLFALVMVWIVVSALITTPKESIATIVLILLGLPLYPLFRRRRVSATPAPTV